MKNFLVNRLKAINNLIYNGYQRFKPHKRLKKVALFVGIVLSFFAGSAFTQINSDDKLYEIQKNLDIFVTLYKEINTFYVDDINPNEIIRTGIDHMLASLDPYTNYIPEEEIEAYRTMTTNQYGGIGTMVGPRNGKICITMPYEGFPAARAGIQIGDEILSIDDIPMEGKNNEQIFKLLKGQANSALKLKIKRIGEPEPLLFNLYREKITINNVPYFGMVENGIGLIKLSDFTSDAGREVKKALEQLKSEGAQKIILDLRGNPGGLLTEAVNVSNIFIPKGSEIVTTKGRVTDWNKTYEARNQPVDNEIPLVVLTSSSSASASEIVAGVSQDYDRGVLVGQKSYGKGLVQAQRPLSYNSQLKVTTAKYYTPSGRCIQAIDYSHRNPDGSIGKVPDSLKQEFKTKSGRLVYDGGGVDPDIATPQKKDPQILQSLKIKGLLFAFATQYRVKHPTIASPKEFEFPNEDYNDFVVWLQGKDYDYTTKVEASFDVLKEIVAEEKHNEELEKKLDELKQTIVHNKVKDLQVYRKEIQEALTVEIATHYYLEKGAIEASFKYDEDVQAAISVLKDPLRYNKILNKN